MAYPHLLLYAAKWGDVATIRRLVAAGDKVDGYGHLTPLDWAVRSRHANVDTLRALLELGADPQRASYLPSNEAKTRFLLKSGVRPSAFLQSELDFGSLRAVLEAGANPNRGDSRLLGEVLYRHGAKGVRLFLDHGFDPVSVGWGDLHLAAALGSVEDVRRALVRGERPQHAYPKEWKWYEAPDPWSIALWVGDLEKLEAMLGAGADPLHLDGKDRTGLFVAAEADRPEVVRWLVGHGVPIDWPWDASEKTALHVACQKGTTKAVDALIELGALNSVPRDADGSPRLYWYAANMDVVHLLIENGLRMDDGVIDALLTIAVERSDDEFARELIAMTQHRNAPGEEGQAMAAAVREDERNIVRMMLDAHWNPNACWDDVTPLRYVCSPEVEHMMVRAGGKNRYCWPWR